MDERKAHITDTFGDAALAMLLDNQAEADGERLWEAYLQHPAVMPPELDQACRRTMRKAFQKAHKDILMGSVRKRAAHVAACLAVLLVTMTTLVFSVEAIRVPVLNFIIKHGGTDALIQFEEKKPWEYTPLTQLQELLDSTIPEGYLLVAENVTTGRSKDPDGFSQLARFYRNGHGDTIQILITAAQGAMSLDTENADVSSLTLAGYEAMLIENDYLQVLWINPLQYLAYHISSSGMEKDAFLQYVTDLADLVSAMPTTP